MYCYSLTEMLREYKSILDNISPVLVPLMKPYKDKVEQELLPGVSSLTWTSLNVSECKYWNVHMYLKGPTVDSAKEMV